MALHPRPSVRWAALALAAGAAAGCDPIVTISGAFFPAWLLCMLLGLVMSAIALRVLDRTGLARHAGPRLLLAAALFTASTLLVWLMFFQQ